MRLLGFSLDGHRYGITADTVTEIIRAVAITPLPGSPAVIEGIIDVRGAIVPVFNLRARFALPHKPLEPSDQFVLTRTSARVAALHVDQVADLVDVDDGAVSDPARQVPASPHIAGVATLADGLVLIHDVETFLSHAESETLDAALAARTAPRTAPPAQR
ncbi:MAG: chemotaxis protein CheW [Gemmatimonadaceae bacterium]